MRWMCVLGWFALGGLLVAQNGQQGSRPGWPCVPGRAVDPAYIEISESTGGQLFLFQKNEVAQSAIVMNAPHSHPATLLRAVGHLSGSRDFQFPVDSGVESMLLLVSVQCRNAIRVSRPIGSEVTGMDADFNLDLQSGRIVRVDHPQPGQWSVGLTGTGLFVLSVLAKADLVLGGPSFSTTGGQPLKNPLLGVAQNLQARLSGQASNVRRHLVNASAEGISTEEAMEPSEDGWRTSVTPLAERFRVVVTGADSYGRPFQRMYPVLFRAQPSAGPASRP